MCHKKEFRYDFNEKKIKQNIKHRLKRKKIKVLVIFFSLEEDKNAPRRGKGTAP